MIRRPELSRRGFNRAVPRLASGILLLLGGIVITGWLFRIELLKCVIPGVEAMKPNMAAGFLLCGTTLAIVSRRTLSKSMRTCAMAISASVALFSALTVGEHLFGWNFQVEDWLIAGNLPGDADTLHAGRVSTPTAFGFLISGSALFAASLSVSRPLRFRMVVALGAILVLMGAIPLAGFLLEITLGPQWNFMGMTISGVPCAVGFMLLGSGLLALLQSEGRLTWSLNRLTTAGFITGALLIVVAAAGAFSFTRRMADSAASIVQREESLKEIQKILTNLTWLTSQERLYVLTGDEALLTRREQTIAEVKEDFLAVRQLISENPGQQAALHAAEILIGQHIDWEGRVITVRRREGAARATEMITSAKGIELFDEVTQLLTAMQAEEYRLLKNDRAQAQSASGTAFSLLPAGVFLSLVILSLGIFSLNLGVSEQKRTETDLRQSEERMRAILESALDSVITMDHHGTIVEFNPAAEKTFGYRRDEAIGQTLSELIIPPELRERHRMGLSRYLATGNAHLLGKRLELSAARRDGSEFPVELAITRIGTQEPPLFTGFIRDITERRRSENALKQAEAKYRSIFENAVEGIFQTTPDGRFIAANLAMARMLGFDSVDELVAARTDIARQNYVDPASRDEFKRLLERDGSVYDFELEAIRRNGSPIWLSENVLAVRDENGRVAYYEGTAEDITQRKRTEDALRASEAHLQAVVENLNEGVVVSDLNGELLHWNRAALKIHGIKSLDEGRRALNELADTFEIADMTGTVVPVNQWPLSRILRGEKLHGLELRVKNIKDDWERIFDYGGTLVQDADSESLMAIVTIRDITERKHAEERLFEQAEIINHARDAVIIRNVEDEKIIFWNNGAENLYGWSAEEAAGRPIGEIVVTDANQREAATEVLLSTGEFHGEIKQMAKDGREITVNCRATLIRNSDGSPRSVLFINTDVTEQKKLETQLLRSQRLESIGTLAGGVAHDLNNILTPILVCSQTLAEGHLSEKDRRSALSMIEQSARRGASVVKQVLTFARGIEGERVLIQPRHLIDEIIDIARKTFPKSIEIRSSYPANLWSIQGDPTQLHQVLLNLSVNARDAMPNGGTLNFAAENFSADEHYAAMTPGAKAGPYLSLSVTDSGMGMARATIDKIFDPFFTTKEVGKGTGLGLSTALGIVKSHGGFISIYSELRQGTTFKIFLPATMSDEDVQKSQTASVPVNGNGEQILIVDDEANILKVTKMIFEKHNYRVLSASDGPEALALFAQKMKDIGGVVTDISMPYMDGVALVRALKKMKSDIPIIASTGQGDQPGVDELEALGVTNFLTKPYNTEKLLVTVHETLRAGAQLASPVP